MSQFPSMPLFVDAYLADTTHFTAEEHGAYLLLLMAMWRRRGWVVDNDRDLARMCCVNARRWPRVKKRLIPLLIQKDGELSQKRLWRAFAELRNRNAQKRSSDKHTEMNGNNGLDTADSRVTRGTRAIVPISKTNTSTDVDVNAREARSKNKPRKNPMLEVIGRMRAALRDQEDAHDDDYVLLPPVGHH